MCGIPTDVLPTESISAAAAAVAAFDSSKTPSHAILSPSNTQQPVSGSTPPSSGKHFRPDGIFDRHKLMQQLEQAQLQANMILEQIQAASIGVDE